MFIKHFYAISELTVDAAVQCRHYSMRACADNELTVESGRQSNNDGVWNGKLLNSSTPLQSEQCHTAVLSNTRQLSSTGTPSLRLPASCFDLMSAQGFLYDGT